MPTDRQSTPMQPVAGIVAYLLPGAGYLVLGQTRRAIVVGGAILAMYLGGMLIGGLDVAIRQADALWSIFHIGLKPLIWATGMIDARLLSPGDVTVSLGRVNEVGSLYVAMASFLNLIAAVDCLFHEPPPAKFRKGDLGGDL